MERTKTFVQTTVQTPPQVFPLSRRQRTFLITLSLLLGDGVALWLAFSGATLLRFFLLKYPLEQVNWGYYGQMALVYLGLGWVTFALFRLYSSRLLFGGLQEYGAVLNASTVTAVGLVMADFFLNRGAELSRGWWLALWGLSVTLAGFFRFGFRRLIYFLRRRGHFLRPAIIVNADEEGKALFEHLATNPSSGLRIRGFVDDHLPKGEEVVQGVRVLGGLEALEDLLRADDIEEVIVATGSLDQEQLLQIFRSVSPAYQARLRFSSGLFELLSTGLYIKELASVPLIEVEKVRITGINALLKAVLDYVLAVMIMILGAPLFLVIMLAVRLDSPGPIFYRHRVLGLHGKEFDAFKFRTMYVNGDEILAQHPELKRAFEENWKLKDDPRVTRVGRLLRRTSLDELPQMVNVLLGQMSVIGPRFIARRELSKFGRWGTNLLTIKPGITGLWQVSGRSDTSYDERVRLDMYYIRNWTIWLDIYILLSTIPAVLSRKGAY